jgi:hypothetical protein
MPDLLVNDLSYLRARAFSAAIRYAAMDQMENRGINVKLDKWDIVRVASVHATISFEGASVNVEAEIQGALPGVLAWQLGGGGFSHIGMISLRTVKECLEFLLELTSNPAIE